MRWQGGEGDGGWGAAALLQQGGGCGSGSGQLGKGMIINETSNSLCV
jgi:hypothetical protein